MTQPDVDGTALLASASIALGRQRQSTGRICALQHRAGGDPEQRQELPSMDYPHSSALPSPPWPGIPLPKQGVLYSILTALCTHPSTLLLDGSLHCGLMDITPGTGQAWLSQCTDSMAPTDALEMVYG